MVAFALQQHQQSHQPGDCSILSCVLCVVKKQAASESACRNLARFCRSLFSSRQQLCSNNHVGRANRGSRPGRGGNLSFRRPIWSPPPQRQKSGGVRRPRRHQFSARCPPFGLAASCTVRRLWLGPSPPLGHPEERQQGRPRRHLGHRRGGARPRLRAHDIRIVSGCAWCTRVELQCTACTVSLTPLHYA